MLKAALAFAALVAFLSAAQAQVTLQRQTTVTTTETITLPTPPASPAGSGYEQATMPVVPAPMPPSSQFVAIELDCAIADDEVYVRQMVDRRTAEPHGIHVVHHLSTGAYYDRSEQYRSTGGGKVDGTLSYWWQGAWVRDPQVSMLGRLVYNSYNQWVYSELVTVPGKPSHAQNFPCNVVHE
jgi:hypothetical protein